jgi:hypothetical protein
LAACIVPVAVLLSVLIILPAPPLQRSLSAEAPEHPSGVPAIMAEAMAPPPGVSIEATIAPTGPSVDQAPGTESGSLPPPSKLPQSPPRPSASSLAQRSPLPAREAPQRTPHAMAKAMLAAGASRPMPQHNRPANDQQRPDQTAGSEAVASVAAPSYPMDGPAHATGDEAQSPLFEKVLHETCMGSYVGMTGGAAPVKAHYYPIQAHFWRGPGDAPWVTFLFATQKPLDLPVTISGSKFKITNTYGTVYTLAPSGNILLPPRYHRFTGAAEQPPDWNIDFTCGVTRKHPS